jgi:hypothetical protein
MERMRSIALFAASVLLLADAARAESTTLVQIRASGVVRLGYVAEARPF